MKNAAVPQCVSGASASQRSTSSARTVAGQIRRPARSHFVDESGGRFRWDCASVSGPSKASSRNRLCKRIVGCSSFVPYSNSVGQNGSLQHLATEVKQWLRYHHPAPQHPLATTKHLVRRRSSKTRMPKPTEHCSTRFRVPYVPRIFSKKSGYVMLLI